MTIAMLIGCAVISAGLIVHNADREQKLSDLDDRVRKLESEQRIRNLLNK